jgi:hypothetical protein
MDYLIKSCRFLREKNYLQQPANLQVYSPFIFFKNQVHLLMLVSLILILESEPDSNNYERTVKKNSRRVLN